MYKIEGKLVEVSEEQIFSEKFSKVELVLTRLAYTNKEGKSFYDEIQFQATNERINNLKGFKKGDLVEIEFTIRCNKYKEKYFTNLNLIAIKKKGATTPNEPLKEDLSVNDLPF